MPVQVFPECSRIAQATRGVAEVMRAAKQTSLIDLPGSALMWGVSDINNLATAQEAIIRTMMMQHDAAS